MAVEFVNPYNFIPLMGKRAEADSLKGPLSGVIEYSVVTKTPIIIPNTSSDRAFWKKGDECGGDGTKDYHKSFDFFSYTDLDGRSGREGVYSSPVIPGSEMRGVLRSNFEILSNSCMSSLDTDSQLSKRPNYPYQPGLLYLREDGGFELLKAEDLICRTMGADSLVDNRNAFRPGDENKASFIQSSLREGQVVSCIIERRGKKMKAFARNVRPDDGKDNWGCVIKGIAGAVLSGRNKKHLLHVFTPDSTGDNIIAEVTPEILSTMTNVLKEYKKNGVSDYREYEAEFNKFKNREGSNYFPVYYGLVTDFKDRNKQRIYLSPACNTRDMYYNRLRDIAGSYSPCETKTNICPACSLFGMVGMDGEASASRIRVTDLRCDNEEPKDCYVNDYVTLPELGGPKLNNMEFYLAQPDDAWFWTYDYYVDAKGNTHLYTPTLNGRKFYWHFDVSHAKGVERIKRNVTVRPVRKGITFKGKLYFDHVTEEELQQLIWLLNCGDSGNLSTHEHGYKIGMAKPLGYGSVALKVNQVTLKDVSIDHNTGTIREVENNYQTELSDSVFGSSESAKANMKNFRMMTGFNTVKGENVSYPRITNDPEEEGFKWFVSNHKDRFGSGMSKRLSDVIFMRHLEAMNPKLSATGAEEKRKNRNNNSNRNYRGYGKSNYTKKR